jgi:TolB protein
MRNGILMVAAALVLAASAAGARAAVGRESALEHVTGMCDPASPQPCFGLESTIAFSSTRDDPTGNPLLVAEIYLINPDGTNPRRLTENTAGDAFAALSPDGKKIVFDSNRARAEGEPINTSHLFLMNTDGTEQTLLTRGSSATWSPDSKNIAFHASALGTATPIRTDPGSATSDSDIFVANVDDLLAGLEQPRNITNSPNTIDDDPDWSPDGQELVFTSHDVDDPSHTNPVSAEIYLLTADGTGTPERLTFNAEEERGAAWSPDGARIVFSCRRGGPDFEICVMNADGTGQLQLTNNSVPDLTPTWSPDGQQIVFNGPGLMAGQGIQLFMMKPTLNAFGKLPTPAQLTVPPGLNLLANWGELRVRSEEPAQ